MFFTGSNRLTCAIALLISVIGLVTATFQGQSTCGLNVHRASGLVLWCETQGLAILSGNLTIYVAPMNATTNRVAIYNVQISSMIGFGPSTTVNVHFDHRTGQFMIVESYSTFIMITLPQSIPNGFKIMSGNIAQNPKNLTTVYTSISTTEIVADQIWINGVFIFSTTYNGAFSYKAFVPSDNGFSFVEVFSNATATAAGVKAWTMDGTSRLCLSVTEEQSYIVCRGLTNNSEAVIIHTSDSSSVAFTVLVSDNNGRVFWGEVNGTASWRVWAANSDKSDTPIVIDRTTAKTFVIGTVKLGYDSFNKLVYWTESIPIVPEPIYASDVTFAVYGWDGKSNTTLVYFTADNQTQSAEKICAYNGQMMISSNLPGINITRHLFHTAPSTSTPASVLLFAHVFQDTSFQFLCDETSGWAVVAYSDVLGQIGSAVSAIRIDNTTSLQIQLSADTNITLGASVSLTDGIVGYTVGNALFGIYDIVFYTLPAAADSVTAPSDGQQGPAGNTPASPNTNTPVVGPSSKVSFANQLAPIGLFASLAYLLF
eukprot:TRINITY_DN3925_c0_g1_i1.p1 TRINITY_DN3925_c0_g1~~TRINITY_DN3925_c0_g1_i1.p1  ORF type:complete len:541 (+),score=124.86 TRINITY_DN3925_c0_g1_i1:459-2081(+)